MEDTNRIEKNKIKVQSHSISTQVFKFILNQSYLRRLIFNHVSSIHKQLEITTVKVSSLYTLIDYIRYGLNDLFFKHIDQLWSLMFPDDGRYRNDNNGRLTRIITTSIDYHNDIVLEYLLNRIKKEIGPFQTMVRINYDHTKTFLGSYQIVNCISANIFKLLVDDNVFIESDDLLQRMAKTTFTVIGDTDTIQNLFQRYKLKNLCYLFADTTNDNKTITIFKYKNDYELIQVYNVVKKDPQFNDWRQHLVPLLSPFSTKNTIENERKRALFKNRSSFWSKELFAKFGNATDLDFLQYNIVAIWWVQVCYMPNKFKRIHPIFCSRRYIDLLSMHRYSILSNTYSQIVRSTLQQAPIGKEYEELDYLLNSSFGQQLTINLVDAFESIIDHMGGDDSQHLIERLVAHVHQHPNRCALPVKSISKFINSNHPGRDQFISFVRTITNEILPDLYKFPYNPMPHLLHPSIVASISKQFDGYSYYFLTSAAMSNDFELYKRIYKLLGKNPLRMDHYSIKMILSIINAGYHEIASQILDFNPPIKLLPPPQGKMPLKKCINLLFPLCFSFIMAGYWKSANTLIEIVQPKKQHEIIYYAIELTDDQFSSLWKRYSKDIEISKWLDYPMHHLKHLKYDQKFFNHLQRIYNHIKQDQLDQYQFIKYPMNPPPLIIEYIGIWNQCLQNYYFQNNNINNNNNNNRIVNNYTQKEYEDFMSWAIEFGFIIPKLE
ncbi:hypothetical protein DFA_10300 [Cavenderia fasciculata]|uniref:Uncharacterized protein n=1 Tax=Cavenderia fasciculata TaxID=261658 RepID=F4Q9U2_CACFS|nr:uncharacterized protein DFA_10300 [Cavenderia fasciculata]EGG15461.1 hypothetical protein DFA_10300 [Cavenderia fasciculata]|eukprot:XP_004354203.1 hypothetical protein DFA_10300 [Cavenderia fasciculata]